MNLFIRVATIRAVSPTVRDWSRRSGNYEAVLRNSLLLFYLEFIMKQSRLNLYTVNLKYIRNLAYVDDNVFPFHHRLERANVLF